MLRVSKVINKKFPSSSVLAKPRYNTTVTYPGINSAEPRRNMARWENFPRGGLGRWMSKFVSWSEGDRDSKLENKGYLPDIPRDGIIVSSISVEARGIMT